MGKIYVGQTKLIIEVDLKSNITDATVILKYCKPDGETGSFPAVISDADNGVVKRQIEATTDIDQSGRWLMWAHVTYGDGKVAAGEPFDFKVYAEGC
jgi:hypothetical protein